MPAKPHSSSRQAPFCADHGHLGSGSPMPKGFSQSSCNAQCERCPHIVTLHRGNWEQAAGLARGDPQEERSQLGIGTGNQTGWLVWALVRASSATHRYCHAGS